MEDRGEVEAICTSYFNELIQNREANDGDQIRLYWREAVRTTCQEFPEMDDQQVYQLTEEVLWESLGRFETKVELDWLRVEF